MFNKQSQQYISKTNQHCFQSFSTSAEMQLLLIVFSVFLIAAVNSYEDLQKAEALRKETKYDEFWGTLLTLNKRYQHLLGGDGMSADNELIHVPIQEDDADGDYNQFLSRYVFGKLERLYELERDARTEKANL